MIRILLADDHTMVRAGLHALIDRFDHIQVIGEASNGQEAVELAQELRPDILLMDIMMPRLNGIQAAEHIRDFKIPVKIILLSMYSDEALIHQAMNSGVKGYVLKTSLSDELLLAIQTVTEGRTYLSAEIATKLESRPPIKTSDETNPIEALSPREKEILQLIAEENTSAEIAKLLFISEKTVEKHRANLMEKLNVRNLVGLVKLAVKYRLIEKD